MERKTTIDINCDMGEGFGAYRPRDDAALLELATSANIACGFHAGDPAIMRETVRLCAARGVAVGAHPGLPDPLGFGRRDMRISAQEAYDMVVYQIGALQGFAKAEGTTLRHVKPHGALYNMAATDRGLAEAIADAVRRVDPQLALYALAGSELAAAGRRAGLRTAGEAFADRAYRADGTLVPRGEPGAVIADASVAAARTIAMLQSGFVAASDGSAVAIDADTVCVHGDGEHAIALLRQLRAALSAAGIEAMPFR